MESELLIQHRELSAQVLVEVCGWKWMRTKRNRLCVLHPPEPYDFDAREVWLPCNWGSGVYEPFTGVPSPKQRYSDWHRGVSMYFEDRHQFKFGIPLPSKNIADAECVLSTYWTGDVEIRRQNKLWRCELFQPSREWEEWGETAAIAICRALLNAVRNPRP